MTSQDQQEKSDNRLMWIMTAAIVVFIIVLMVAFGRF
jgi:multidrug efflux pump subunit AcrB